MDNVMADKRKISKKMISELDLININCRFVYEKIVKTNVPKVFISANGAIQTKDEFLEYFEYVMEQQRKVGTDVMETELTYNNSKDFSKFIALELNKSYSYLFD